MSEIAEFLLARIAEDETLARDALRPRYGSECDKPQWLYDGNPSGAFTAGAYTIGQASSWAEDDRQGGRFARHIVNWDPARTLAECEAKRRIVEHARGWEETLYWEPGKYKYSDEGCTTYRMAMHWVLEQLALPYANHPDYYEGWRP